MGNGQIKGFKEAIIGMKIGDEKKVKLEQKTHIETILQD
ncbi:MAG: hypothetical protein JSV67_06925 [Thermoplasmatales archaeon]|nr:MAG: hypothetical protein JSV67_06925 [Thermoplasmatales archaeon]